MRPGCDGCRSGIMLWLQLNNLEAPPCLTPPRSSAVKPAPAVHFNAPRGAGSSCCPCSWLRGRSWRACARPRPSATHAARPCAIRPCRVPMRAARCVLTERSKRLRRRWGPCLRWMFARLARGWLPSRSGRVTSGSPLAERRRGLSQAPFGTPLKTSPGGCIHICFTKELRHEEQVDQSRCRVQPDGLERCRLGHRSLLWRPGLLPRAACLLPELKRLDR